MLPMDAAAGKKLTRCENIEYKEQSMSSGTLLIGFVLGIGLTILSVALLAPRERLVSPRSAFGLNETLAALEKGIADTGWSSSRSIDQCKFLGRQGVARVARDGSVQLFDSHCAKGLLSKVPHANHLLAHAVALWGSKDGAVYVSKMNTGLIDKLFDRNMPSVLGERFSKDEQIIPQQGFAPA